MGVYDYERGLKIVTKIVTQYDNKRKRYGYRENMSSECYRECSDALSKAGYCMGEKVTYMLHDELLKMCDRL